MEWWQLVIYGLAGLVAMIFGGISGGGAGFILTPLVIFLGLTPAQAISTNKVTGLAGIIGSLSGLRSKEPINKRRVGAIMALAFVVGLAAPYVIRSLSGPVYRIILGVLILAMIPVLIHKKVGHTSRTPTTFQRNLGGILLTVSLFLQGALSGGMGSLVNIVLMGLLGQSANEAHITKRWSQLVLNTTIIVSVLSDHFIVWPVVAVATTASLVGGYIGGRIATRKGDKFAMNTLLVLMGLSAVFLIGGAF